MRGCTSAFYSTVIALSRATPEPPAAENNLVISLRSCLTFLILRLQPQPQPNFSTNLQQAPSFIMNFETRPQRAAELRNPDSRTGSNAIELVQSACFGINSAKSFTVHIFKIYLLHYETTRCFSRVPRKTAHIRNNLKRSLAASSKT